MPRILVAYGTKYGATAEIAERIGAALRDAGADAEVRRAREVRSLDGYDAVVLGSAVYMARWRRDALRLLRRLRSELGGRPLWLFSSGLVGEEPDEDPGKWVRPARVQALAEQLGARDHAGFGGQVADDGGFMRRRMARDLPAELRDRRDWDAIERWARDVAAAVAGGPR